MTETPEETQADHRAVVLFVDDEPQVLSGLRSALRPLQRNHRLFFAVGADEALTVLAENDVHVIVTEAEMVGTSGLELLARVRDDYPTTVRLVLAGTTGPQELVDAMPVVHRWLSKPCSRADLIEAVTEAVHHQSFLEPPTIAEALVGTSSLPSPPQLHMELQRLLRSPDVSIAEVAALVETDPAVASKIMQWATSALAGGGHVPDVHGAIVRLGLVVLQRMVLMAGLVRSVDPSTRIPGYTFDQLIATAGRVSDIAGRLAPPNEGERARVGGLFSMLGLLLEADVLGERLYDDYAEAERLGRPLIDIEEERNGAAHPALAAHLLALWGLPTPLVDVIWSSHDVPAADDHPTASALEAVQRARLVAQATAVVQPGSPHVQPLSEDLQAAVDVWSEAARAGAERLLHG
ncbi:MAG: HDOD domain-containing protein [Actinomycetota bacterium]